MVGCIFTRRGRIRFGNILPFDGDVSILPTKDFLVVGWGRGFSWPGEVDVETVVSMSPYTGFLLIDRRYLRIRAGTRVASLLRFLMRRRVWVDLIYPWDPMESIGGLVAQGLNPLRGSAIHVYSGDGYLLSGEYRGGVILDVRTDGLARGDPELVYLIVSRGEAGLLYEELVGIGASFSILRGDTGYYVVVLARSTVERRRLVRGISRFVDKSRIHVWDGRVDSLPMVSERFLGGGVETIKAIELSRDYVPGGLIFYSWPMGVGLVGGVDEEG